MMRDRDFNQGSHFLLSLPAYNKYVNPYQSIDNLKIDMLAIKMNDPTDAATANAIKAQMNDAMTEQRPSINKPEITFSSQDEDLVKVTNILDAIFSVVIVVTMILCLFSLSSSMSANLLD